MLRRFSILIISLIIINGCVCCCYIKQFVSDSFFSLHIWKVKLINCELYCHSRANQTRLSSSYLNENMFNNTSDNNMPFLLSAFSHCLIIQNDAFKCNILTIWRTAICIQRLPFFFLSSNINKHWMASLLKHTPLLHISTATVRFPWPSRHCQIFRPPDRMCLLFRFRVCVCQSMVPGFFFSCEHILLYYTVYALHNLFATCWSPTHTG